MYNDFAGEYKHVFDCIGKTVQDGGLRKLFCGIESKIFYNAVFCWHLRNMYDNNSEIIASFPCWVASYAALTVKTRA